MAVPLDTGAAPPSTGSETRKTRSEGIHRRRSDRLTEHPSAIFLGALVLFFIAFGAWAWATPLMASPDEPVQAIKAAAVVRGELVGTAPHGPGSPDIVVTVPQLYARLGDVPGCYAFKQRVSAACAEPVTGSAAPTRVLIYNGRYPPLYYAIVGLPSLFTISPLGVYLMRLVSALLSAIFLALALTTVLVWSRSRLLLGGLALSATPTLFFLGGAVNPSSLETTAAICLWTAGLVLVLERAEKPPGGLVAILALSGSVFALTRPASPFWLLLSVTALFLAAPRGCLRALSYLSVRLAAGVVALCTVAATAWVLLEHSLDHLPAILPPPGLGEAGIVASLVGRTPLLVTEMIGEFDWHSTPSPSYTYLVWFLGLGAIAAAAFVLARARHLVALASVIVVTVLVPIVMDVGQIRRLGYAWQGRDSLPFAVGIPLLAAAAATVSERGRTVRFSRLVRPLVIGVGLAELGAFIQSLRRNATGLPGPLDYLHGAWHPPLGALAPSVVAALVWLAFAVWWWRLAGRPLPETALDGTLQVAPVSGG